MKYSVTGQEKGDLLIEVTTWTGLTVCQNEYMEQLQDLHFLQDFKKDLEYSQLLLINLMSTIFIFKMKKSTFREQGGNNF